MSIDFVSKEAGPIFRDSNTAPQALDSVDCLAIILGRLFRLSLSLLDGRQPGQRFPDNLRSLGVLANGQGSAVSAHGLNQIGQREIYSTELIPRAALLDGDILFLGNSQRAF